MHQFWLLKQNIKNAFKERIGCCHHRIRQLIIRYPFGKYFTPLFTVKMLTIT
ncbi:Uncharacterised protein [Vibrio cholerae]|nr:Uncharacterised protein [Vibrio cholerae]CSI77691.1 Uncharacterised protein [Vibrio cholerae]CSI82951.1 Uncharacterised protein [Vibrio cholerae]